MVGNLFTLLGMPFVLAAWFVCFYLDAVRRLTASQRFWGGLLFVGALLPSILGYVIITVSKIIDDMRSIRFELAAALNGHYYILVEKHDGSIDATYVELEGPLGDRLLSAWRIYRDTKKLLG